MENTNKSRKKVWLILLAVAIACISIYLIDPWRTSLTSISGRLVGVYATSAGSDVMAPTIRQGQILVVSVHPHRKAEPVPGDIVVYKIPSSDVRSIGRVIGLGNDRLRIENGKIYVNDIELTQPYLNSDYSTTEYSNQFDETTLASDEVWLLGDYRDRSKDSRAFGPIKRDALAGKVVTIF